MNATTLIRWGGLAYLIAGVTLVLQQGYELVAGSSTTSTWVALHVVGYIGLALGLIGFVAIFEHQFARLGQLGVWGFILGFLGNGLTGGAAFLNAFVVPVAPDLAKSTGPIFTGPAAGVIGLAALLVTVGFAMFGVATYRAGLLPGWAAVLTIAGAWFGLAAAFATTAFDVGGIVFGLGGIGLGWGVWRSSNN